MQQNQLETATLAGGCFWCLEAVFQLLDGVEAVQSGYAGGQVADPTYQDVCREITGHAEVVQVQFDLRILSYRELLQVFFTIHDPTQLDGQGADIGTQYRSEIFVHSEGQRLIAEELIGELYESATLDSPIVTKVSKLATFYPAESYHRDYYNRNPAQAYCQLIINPKLAKLRQRFSKRLRS